MKKINIITYMVLSSTLIFTYFHVFSNRLLLNISYAFLGLFCLHSLYKHFLNIIINTQNKEYTKLSITDFIYTFIGAYLTYGLVYMFELNVVVASALIGIVGHVFLKKHENAIYCGSFAGMTSVLLLTPFEMLFLALLCGIIYATSKNVFKGLGGKLGTIAFTSGLLTFFLFRVEYATSTLVYIPLMNLILIAVIGMLLTYYMQHKLKQTATFASASLSLLFALIVLPNTHLGSTYALLFFAASFAGMSSQDKIKTPVFVILTGVIVGLLFYSLNTHLNGVGGKLGTIALISSTTVYSMNLTYEFFLKKIKLNKTFSP
jgi:hypothetical protein